MNSAVEAVKQKPTYFYMILENWQGCEVYQSEMVFADYVYWPFGGHA